MKAEGQMTLVLIRHGATKSNRERRYLGKTDESLSEEGRLQLMEHQRQRLYPDIELLFTSPMKRCLQTAEILYPQHRAIPVEEWREMDFGAFEGKNYLELQGDARYQAWLDSSGELPFPDGESRESFVGRCCVGFQKMMAEAMDRLGQGAGHRAVGAVVHGGTIMALLSRYGGGAYFGYQTENGKGYACAVKHPGVITDIQALMASDGILASARDRCGQEHERFGI